MILVDAGPLVAIMSATDRHHERAVAALHDIREPLVTAWPVITESMYLLGRSWPDQDRLWDMLVTGIIGLLPLTPDDVPRMRALMDRYQDLPMNLADAALVRLAEREGISRVLTLDRRDFTVYRPAGLGAFTLLP